MRDTYSEIRAARRLVWAGIALGLATALTIGMISLVSSEGDSPLAALALLLITALPSTIAFLSLDRRPSLLPAAAMSAGLIGIVTLAGGIGAILLITALLWALAIRRRPGAQPSPRWSSLKRPAIAALTLVPLIAMVSHLDPVCTVLDADGNVLERRVDSSAPSGWRLSSGDTVSGSSSSTEGVIETCSSNVVEHWEAALSAAVSIGVAGLAARWPTNDELLARSPTTARTQA